MANVLGTLFGDIADAIREKSGESGTMKPAEFPEKISGISTGTSAEILENIPIALDFSGGNQTITAPDGTLVKTAIIQKPDTLTPANIAQGVDIAGIIGTLAGGGSGALKFKSGYVGASSITSEHTFYHTLGIVPDIILLYIEEPPVQNKLYFALGFSDKMLKALGDFASSIAYSLQNNTAMSMGSLLGFESENVKAPISDGTGYSFINSVTERTFKAGGSKWPLAQKQYAWVAIGGITG